MNAVNTTCPACNAPMIATRSGNQLVCTKCDHFEVLRANPNAGAPVAAVAEPARTVAPKPVGAPKASPPSVAVPAARRGAFAEDLARTLRRAADLARRAAEAFALNGHPRVDEISKMLTVAASGIESTIPHVDHWPAKHVGVKPAKAARAPKAVAGKSAAILKFALARETFTLADFSAHMVAYVPRGWGLALVAKRAVSLMRPLLDRGALQRISPGIYGITAVGAELAKAAEASEPTGPAHVPALKPPKAEKPVKAEKPAKAAKASKPAKAAKKTKAKVVKATKAKPAKIAAGMRVAIVGDPPRGIVAVTSAKERANLTVRAVRDGKASVQNPDGGIRFEIDVDRLEARP